MCQNANSGYLGVVCFKYSFVYVFGVLLCNFQMSYYKYVLFCNQININVIKKKNV